MPLTTFSELPDELLIGIINRIPSYKALCTFGKVSTRCRAFTSDPRIIIDWLLYQYNLDSAVAFLVIGNDHGCLPEHLSLLYLDHLLSRPSFILPRYLYQLALEAISTADPIWKNCLQKHAKQSYPDNYWETDEGLNTGDHPADIAIFSQSMLGYSSFPIARGFLQSHYHPRLGQSLSSSSSIEAIKTLVEQAHFNVHFDLTPWRGTTFGRFEDGEAILEKAIVCGHEETVAVTLSYANKHASSYWLNALSKAYASFEGGIFVRLLSDIQEEDAKTQFWSYNNTFPLQKRQEILLDFLATSAKNNVVHCFCTLLQSADMLSIPAAQSHRIWLGWSIRHSDKYSQILIFVERLLILQQQQKQQVHEQWPSSMTSPTGLSHLSSQTALIDHVKPLLSQLYFQMSTLTSVPS